MRSGQKAGPDERDRRIVEAWLDRPKRQRHATAALDFYRWLLEHAPDLIPPGAGSYDHVIRLIEPHIVEPSS
jgi:hypothetical protein